MTNNTKKNIELKPADNNEQIEEQPITTEPQEEKPEEDERFYMNLPHSEGDYFIQQIANICMNYQGTSNLPETSRIEKDPNFYLEEILNLYSDHGILSQMINFYLKNKYNQK